MAEAMTAATIEAAALTAYAHAMRRGQTWRHAVRDAVRSAEATRTGVQWMCPICGKEPVRFPDQWDRAYG